MTSSIMFETFAFKLRTTTFSTQPYSWLKPIIARTSTISLFRKSPLRSK